MLVIRNKPDVMRKGFETAGIVEAISKELESEDLLEDLVADHYATFVSKPLSPGLLASFMERTLGRTA